jgi:TPR repeat protein
MINRSQKIFVLITAIACMGSLYAQQDNSDEKFQSAKALLKSPAGDPARLLGFDLMREAADQGNTKAQSIVGYHLAQGDVVPRSFPDALNYLTRAATDGDTFAAKNLRHLCESPQSNPPSQKKQAFEGLRSAADAGSVPAAAQTAELFYFGCDGTTPQDYAQAAAYLRVAADGGDLKAANMLGVILQEGLAEEKDEATAAKYFEKAAQQGYAKAQANLGRAFISGYGVNRDFVKAFMWLQLSALQGEPTGKNTLADFIRGLSYEQICEGNQRVSNFLKARGENVSAEELTKKIFETPALETLSTNSTKP